MNPEAGESEDDVPCADADTNTSIPNEVDDKVSNTDSEPIQAKSDKNVVAEDNNTAEEPATVEPITTEDVAPQANISSDNLEKVASDVSSTESSNNGGSEKLSDSA